MCLLVESDRIWTNSLFNNFKNIKLGSIWFMYFAMLNPIQHIGLGCAIRNQFLKAFIFNYFLNFTTFKYQPN